MSKSPEATKWYEQIMKENPLLNGVPAVVKGAFYWQYLLGQPKDEVTTAEIKTIEAAMRMFGHIEKRSAEDSEKLTIEAVEGEMLFVVEPVAPGGNDVIGTLEGLLSSEANLRDIDRIVPLVDQNGRPWREGEYGVEATIGLAGLV